MEFYVPYLKSGFGILLLKKSHDKRINDNWVMRLSTGMDWMDSWLTQPRANRWLRTSGVVVRAQTLFVVVVREQTFWQPPPPTVFATHHFRHPPFTPFAFPDCLPGCPPFTQYSIRIIEILIMSMSSTCHVIKKSMSST